MKKRRPFPAPRPRRSWEAAHFTLIEMLVVVAIIGILAALLSPALQKALKRARSLDCVSHLHAIGGAYFMYAEDWNGTYPPGNMQAMSEYCFRQGWEKTFPHLLGTYLGYPQFHAEKYGSWQIMPVFRASPFVCPEFPQAAITTMFRGGYGINIRVGSYERYVSNSWNGIGLCHKASSIKSPGTLTRMTDRYNDFHLDLWGVSAEDLLNPREARIDLARHLDGCNILFFDGHVKWYGGADVVENFDKAYRLGGDIK